MEPIAIIGIGCRFPGANGPEAFWKLLCEGKDAIAEVPKDRWDIDAYYDAEPGKPGKMSTRWGGFLDQVDQFDAAFFGISPREVERMDPQQRLVLEVAWEALEQAGIAPETLSGTQTGVFMGIGNYDYCRLLNRDVSRVSAYDGTGNTLSIAANRLSYILNLRGPSVVVETACSSSLVAVHFASRSLQLGESDLCLVGGVSLMLSPEPFITYSHARMMASDGRCKTFDARADGYVRGEGGGVVLLKRLADARRDGDNVLAVIRGTAVNQDGTSNGLTAPNGPSQQAVIRQALQQAGVEPEQISYVEAHGTGTSLGDPIEFKSLKAVLMKERQSAQPCWLGSVKTNIGHLEAASGIASLIKVTLALQHQTVPPHLHLEALNPYISLEGTTFTIPTQLQPWRLADAAQRLAGISAFGFGGTNCHVIVEEGTATSVKDGAIAPASDSTHSQQPSDRPYQVLTLSAKTEPALHELAQRYVDYLTTHPDAVLADVCFTANTGRSHFEYRLAAVANSSELLQQQLQAFVEGRQAVGLVSGQANRKQRPKIAFLFTGQGSQAVGMARQLYETQPLFRQTLDQCDEILRPYLERPLLEVLYSRDSNNGSDQKGSDQDVTDSANDSIQDADLIHETAYTQPALFAVEYALAKLWQSWGIEPTAVMGHSVGEYVAACLAGVFSLEAGLKLIAERARLMQALPKDGAMVAVFADADRVAEVIQPFMQSVAIAAINGTTNTVISGQVRVIEVVVDMLETAGFKNKALQVSHAFHSPLMEPMLAEFEAVAATVAYGKPQLKLVSNLTGEWATEAIATPTYWRDHVRQPVRFAASMATLHQQGYKTFVEIGAKPILLGMGRYCLPDVEAAWLPSLYPDRDNWQQLLHSLGSLYVQGCAVNWQAFDQNYSRQRVQLPTYPFQRQRYWVDLGASPGANQGHLMNGQSSNGQSSNGQSSNGQALLTLVNGDTQSLVQQLTAAGNLAEDEVKLLPKLLNLLAQQAHASGSTTAHFADLQDWFYQVEWQLKSRESSTLQQAPLQQAPLQQALLQQEQSGSWLILADRGGVGQALAERLRSQGQACRLVYWGEATPPQDAESYTLNPTDPKAFDRLLQVMLETCDRPLQGIIHLWSLDADALDALLPPMLEQSQVIGVGSVLQLLQALIKQKLAVLPRLWLVTRGATPVERSLSSVAQVPLWGLGRVIALEHPELWGGLIDLAPDLALPEHGQAPHLQQSLEPQITALLTEITDPQGDDHLALRQGQRYVARLVRSPQTQFHPVTLKADCTYLITGGLGALGLSVARWMVEQGARHLVLTGRRGASPQAQTTLTQLEQAGAKVLVAQADVAQQADVAHVIEAIATSLPPLRGVIHAAGVLDDGILLQQNWERFNRVMQPKVQGAWHLHALTQALPLDFFVTFSSAASLIGSPGQGNYAAANAFMDGLAHYRQSLGLPGLSINWGPWSNSGMAAGLDERHQARMAAQGLKAIAPEQGVRALAQALGQPWAQVGVLPFDWSVFGKQLSPGKPLSLLADLMAQIEPDAKAAPSPANALLQQLQAIPQSDRLPLLTTYLQGKAAQVLGTSTADLDAGRSLYEMGLDSLMAVEITTLIRTELQVELPIQALIENPSITNIAALVWAQLSPQETQTTATETQKDELDLAAEAVLDAAIHPSNAQIPPVDEPAAILLTGGTGFLGAFLLQELLDQTQADIYCLVRSADQETAQTRLQSNLQFYDLWQPHYSSRIIPVLGDLGEPQLGVSDEQFLWLASKIDAIYHNGALLNYVYPYSKFKPINVLGTQEVLRLACQTKVKPVHHVSSVAVFESSAYYGQLVTEADPIDRSEGIYLGYSQSKWVSEKLVQIAGQRGLPVTIYRPPLVSGHSQTGVWNTSGFLCRMIKGCVQMGCIMADLDLMLDLSPVDYNSQAIVYLSRQPRSLGQVFHLQNPRLLHWSQLVEFICSMGYPIEQVTTEEWQARLSQARENPLYPLLPFFRHKWSDEQLTYMELNEQGKRPVIGYEATLAALEGSAIACPPLDSHLLNLYFSYFIRSGFIEAPKVGVGSR